jgi:hypothetical protein
MPRSPRLAPCLDELVLEYDPVQARNDEDYVEWLLYEAQQFDADFPNPLSFAA